MKTASLFLLFMVAFIAAPVFSQEMTDNIVIITKYELRNAGEDSVPGELDSLSRLYEKAITDGNEFIIEHSTLRHYWGNNNADLLLIYKVKNWEDIPKANQRMDELFNQTWSDESSRKAFDKAYNKYFTGRHSDEIYREIR